MNKKDLFLKYQKQAQDTVSVQAETLLSTDYLNHFYEPVMLLEMSLESPDCLDLVEQWRFLTYYEHFRKGNLAEKNFILKAYEIAPRKIRQSLEERAASLAELLRNGLTDVRMQKNLPPSVQYRLMQTFLKGIHQELGALKTLIYTGILPLETAYDTRQKLVLRLIEGALLLPPASLEASLLPFGTTALDQSQIDRLIQVPFVPLSIQKQKAAGASSLKRSKAS